MAPGSLGMKASQSASEVAVVLSVHAFSVQGVFWEAVGEFQHSLVLLLPLSAEQID